MLFKCTLSVFSSVTIIILTCAVCTLGAGTTLAPGATRKPGATTAGPISYGGNNTTRKPRPRTTPCVTNAAQTAWSKENYPNPQYNVTQCGRHCRKSWVCDPNRILDTATGDRLDYMIDRIKDHQDCSSICEFHCKHQPGFKVGVALIEKLFYPEWKEVTEEETWKNFREFAHYLRVKSWKSDECKESVVILVSRDDRKIYTAVGEKAREYLTDNCTSEIHQEIVADLKKNDYDTALKHLISRYGMVFMYPETCGKPPVKHDDTGGIVAGVVIGVLVAIIIIVAVVCRNTKGKCDGSGRSGHSGHRDHRYHNPRDGRGTGESSDDKVISGHTTGDGGGGAGGSF